jgi:hypothetical protein
MDIKKYEGSMSLEAFAYGLRGNKTLGDVWEDCVTCNHCSQREACKNLVEQMSTERGIDLFCGQVIDILLGNLKIEEVE